jgi:drug/metabolite transporter (DMT)-like permease
MNTIQSLNSEKKGALYAIFSGLFYGLLGYFGVNLLQSGFSVYNLSFWRFLTATLFLVLVIAFKEKGHLKNRRLKILSLVNGGIFYAMPGNLFFYSSGYIGTGQAMVIFFVFPLFVMLLNWLVLKEPIKGGYILSFILILLGLVLMVDLSEFSADIMGMSLSLMAGFSYAMYIFLSKKMGSISPLEASLMVSLGCAITGGTLALMDASLALPNSFTQVANILGLGIVCSALPIIFLFKALRYISSEKASLLSVLEPVFVVIFGVLLLGESIPLRTLIGILFTLGGAMSVYVIKKPVAIKLVKDTPKLMDI